jgi:hypothetical protein
LVTKAANVAVLSSTTVKFDAIEIVGATLAAYACGEYTKPHEHKRMRKGVLFSCAISGARDPLRAAMNRINHQELSTIGKRVA